MSEIVLRPRSLGMLMGLFLIMTMAIVIAACNDNEQEPSRDDQIQAVRNYVSGKTYNKTVTKYERRSHPSTT